LSSTTSLPPPLTAREWISSKVSLFRSDGRRVLDVGAGIGHFAEFYRRMGATVVAIEGRPENVDEMRRLYPQVEAHVGTSRDLI